MSEFEVDIDKFVSKTNKKLDEFVLEFTQDIAEKVVTRSPVDTGFFRSNWRIGIGAPSRESKDEKPEGFEAGEAVATQTSLGAITPKLIGAGAGDVIYINNNADYGERLEYGHSSQAPSGMVRITVAEAPSIARSVARRLNK